MSRSEHFSDIFGEIEHFSGKNGELNWSFLVRKQKYNVKCLTWTVPVASRNLCKWILLKRRTWSGERTGKNGNKAGMCATSYECACGRLGFVTIFHFPVPHALFPLPVLETSSPQVLVLFKWLFSVPGSFQDWHAHLLVQVSDIIINITKESQSHEIDIILCHTG